MFCFSSYKKENKKDSDHESHVTIESGIEDTHSSHLFEFWRVLVAGEAIEGRYIIG